MKLTGKVRAAALGAAAITALATAAAPALAQERPVAFTGATVLPISGPAMENATLVIEDGKIIAIGPDAKVPSNAQVRDATGKVIMPGIVDTHSHIGQVAGADSSGPIQPEVRAMDAINPRDHSIDKARAGGVTTANVMPGSGHLMSGQTFYMKLREVDAVEDLAVRGADAKILGGMKMANGTNSIRSTPGFPGTRAKSAALVRQAFIGAQPYCEKEKEGEVEKRDIGKEALCEILSGERLVHFHTHRADDIMTVLRLREEFGFDVLIQHGMESGDVAEQIAAAGIPVSHVVVDAPGGKLEAMNSRITSSADLERAGVLMSLHSDDPIIDSRMMRRQAGLAVRGGLSRDGALRALTINGAKQLGLDDRIGSLEVGKDADFLILDGDPLSVYTTLEQTWVEGQLLFDVSDPEQAKFATGGEGTTSGARAMHHLENEAHAIEGDQ